MFARPFISNLYFKEKKICSCYLLWLLPDTSEKFLIFLTCKRETNRINVPIYKHADIITSYFLFNLTLFVYKNPSGLLNKDHENYLKELAIHRTLSPDWGPHDFFSMRTSLKDAVFNTDNNDPKFQLPHTLTVHLPKIYQFYFMICWPTFQWTIYKNISTKSLYEFLTSFKLVVPCIIIQCE